jgi:hydrogenase-4 component F
VTLAYPLLLVPLAGAAAALAVPSNRLRPWVLPVAGAVHLALVAAELANPSAPALGGWLVLDAPGKIVLGVLSVLFFLSGLYAVGYLHHRLERDNRVFCACLASFLGVTTLVTWAHHLGLLWIAVEATGLSTAPLIYFNHNPRSIEATWKFLLISSVGIALALLGTFFLAYAALREGLGSSLLFDDLLRAAPRLSGPWLQAAFVLLLVGYGTKMGLAPMHTWKPDAYGEAPGVVGALLAGGMANCAFLSVLRVFQVCLASGKAPFAREMLVTIGLLSVATGALFMIRQRDFKRMLAYSSVEHMGILALGLGLGQAGTFGSLFHIVNNGLTKGVLFLCAGNLHRAYGSKQAGEVTGALKRLPLSGTLFLAGFLAVTGSPPFGPFFSKFAILNAAIASGRFLVAGLYLGFLMVAFLGMATTVLTVTQGSPSAAAEATSYRDGLLTGGPIVILACLVLFLGLYLPPGLEALLHQAAAFVEGGP